MNFLILSAHDYRTQRKASIHFVADELKKKGELRFFSLRYSFISRFKNDFRCTLDNQANKITLDNGVSCYLWKPWIHPVNLKEQHLLWLELILSKYFQWSLPRILKEWISQADYIIFESGLAAIYVEAAKRLNPNAKLIYKASDALDTINASEFVKNYFLKTSHLYDKVALVSPLMANTINYKDNLAIVPHGVEEGLAKLGDPNPYDGGINAVSIGSMLFDANFFVIASQAYPNITFHLIGTGTKRHQDFGPNVLMYDHMPFKETLRYLKHANISIAPYKRHGITNYLADSSMKLLQNEVFGIPSVCPNSVIGNYENRHGYEPDDEASIINAIKIAINSTPKKTRTIPLWSDVASRLISQNIADTRTP